jgi:chromosome segregation ATPase
MSTPTELHAAREYEQRALEAAEAGIVAAATKIAKAQEQLDAANLAHEQATAQRDEQAARLQAAEAAVDGLPVTVDAGVANIGVEGN